MTRNNKVRRVDFSPDEFISGIAGQLTAVDLGVYWLVCSLIYSKRGPIDDDHVWIARILKDTHWRVVRASLDRLITGAKIVQEGGKLWVTRCADELQTAGNRIASATHNGGMGGRPSKNNNEIEKPGGSADEKLSPTINYQPTTNTSTGPGEDGLGSAEPDPGSSPAMQVAQAFDRERVLIFGPERGRAWRHPDDISHAQRFLDAGADPALCREVFRSALGKRKSSGGEPIDNLGYFPKPIASAIVNRGKPMPRSETAPQADPGDRERVTWEGRILAAQQGVSWNTSQWGPHPNDPANWIPAPVREALKADIAKLQVAA